MFLEAFVAAAVCCGLLAVAAHLWTNRIRQNSARLRSELFPSIRTATQVGELVAFFHPFCSAGGGGERVLWTAVEGLLQSSQNTYCVIYAKDTAGDASTILSKVKTQFNIQVDESRISFVYLTTWPWLEAKRYKRLTLIGQSLGSVYVVLEALTLLIPDVFVDTTGFAFPYPLVNWFFGVKVVAYVHYPTISSDMIGVVKDGTAAFNNSSLTAKNPIFRNIKLAYYLVFATLYSFVGSFANVVFANSSWTYGHLIEIWKSPERTSIVYPPCDTSSLCGFPLENRERSILSVAQFRPEKAHTLQIKSFNKLLTSHPEFQDGPLKVKLILLGGCRNADDRAIVEELRNLIEKYNLNSNVEFIINSSYENLKLQLSKASVGIHTMTNEHFGIGIVEYMAAGVIPVAHNSGGPKLDIVRGHSDKMRGYLAMSEDEYSNALYDALSLSQTEDQTIRRNAREYVATKFSAASFQSSFNRAFMK